MCGLVEVFAALFVVVDELDVLSRARLRAASWSCRRSTWDPSTRPRRRTCRSRTPANRSELKIGWWCRGSLLRPSIPNTAANAESRMVSSNMIGTIDGMDETDAGLPPMMMRVVDVVHPVHHREREAGAGQTDREDDPAELAVAEAHRGVHAVDGERRVGVEVLVARVTQSFSAACRHVAGVSNSARRSAGRLSVGLAHHSASAVAGFVRRGPWRRALVASCSPCS